MNYDLFQTSPLLNMIKYSNLGSATFLKILEFFLNAVVTYKTTAFICEKPLLSGIALICLL